MYMYRYRCIYVYIFIHLCIYVYKYVSTFAYDLLTWWPNANDLFATTTTTKGTKACIQTQMTWWPNDLMTLERVPQVIRSLGHANIWSVIHLTFVSVCLSYHLFFATISRIVCWTPGQPNCLFATTTTTTTTTKRTKACITINMMTWWPGDLMTQWPNDPRESATGHLVIRSRKNMGSHSLDVCVCFLSYNLFFATIFRIAFWTPGQTNCPCATTTTTTNTKRTKACITKQWPDDLMT